MALRWPTPYQTLLENTVPAPNKFLASEEIKACTQLTEMQCWKPGGHQKVVIKVQCHPSHSGPGNPRNPYGNMGSRCNSDSRGYPTQKATESGYWYPKAHQSLARLLPRALTLQNFPPVLWVTKQAQSKRNPPGKETQVLSVRSQAVCAKVAELGVSVGHRKHLPDRVCTKMEGWAGATGKRSNFWSGASELLFL